MIGLMRAARVFISYTHDGDDHRRRILRLAEQLRAASHDVRIDQLVVGTPEGGWPAWMEREIDEADFVLVICTPNYHERYRQEGDHHSGLGGRWEGSLIRNSLYGDESQLFRFIPVLSKTSTPDDIPLRLRHSATFFALDDHDAISEYIRVSHRPGPDSANSAFGQSTQADSFAPEITQLYAEIDRKVEQLTQEQFDVITRLHGTTRALISGAPGSGKTLVAAEKARRLDAAGIKTLFLCHNPLLALWVSRLVSGTQVEVRAFEDLVAYLASDAATALPWSAYSEPTGQQLVKAREALEQRETPPYGAVIVDEGQDFAADWWPVVERCVPPGSTFYVFFDEQQSLVKGRMQLPALGWPSTLSRNCRNSGRVYDAMRRLAPIRQLPEQELERLGHVAFFARPSTVDSLRGALGWLSDLGALDSTAAVIGGAVDFAGSVLATGPYLAGEHFAWREAVSQQFLRVSRLWHSHLLGDFDVNARLAELSEAPVPSSADVEVVAVLATEMLQRYGPHGPRESRSRVRPGRVSWRPVADAQRVPGVWEWRLRVAGHASANGIDVLEALRSGAWADAIEQPRPVAFAEHELAEPGEIPVFSVGEIKGLERESVLLVLEGDAPQWGHELFVGVSRARSVLAVVLQVHAAALLPPKLSTLMH
jgi:hypothetical protein